ncbi:MAG: ABC transporter substrate-binding protein [Caldilineales bacterium]
MQTHRLLFLSLWLMISLLAGCTPPAAAPATPAAADPTTPVSTEAAVPSALTLGLGYIPSVQFAPFYVAQAKGFFAQEGLEVTFEHGAESDFMQRIGVNDMQFAIASGEQVILARSQQLPITYVMRWYQRFPVVVMSPAEKGLDEVSKLAGQRVGIPGMYGASLVAWKALSYVSGLDESSVSLETIGFTQAAAVSEGRVDAALDYITNGPVQLRLAGQEVTVIAVADLINLPANGLITNDQTIAENPALVQKMTTALINGIRYTLANPDEAFAISLQAVPEAGGDNEAANRAVFDASLALWESKDGLLGLSNGAEWQEAADFMQKTGLISSKPAQDTLFTNRFAEAAQTP